MILQNGNIHLIHLIMLNQKVLKERQLAFHITFVKTEKSFSYEGGVETKLIETNTEDGIGFTIRTSLKCNPLFTVSLTSSYLFTFNIYSS
jgi:hypothetical protein